MKYKIHLDHVYIYHKNYSTLGNLIDFLDINDKEYKDLYVKDYPQRLFDEIKKKRYVLFFTKIVVKDVGRVYYTVNRMHKVSKKFFNEHYELI